MNISSKSIVIVCGLALALGQAAHAADKCGAPLNSKQATAAITNFYQAFGTKNKDLLDKVLAADWVDVPLHPGQVPGPAGMKPVLDEIWATFPDLNVKIEDVVVEGNKVVVRASNKATQKGEFVGLPATNKAIEFMSIDMHEFCNGKVVKTWHVEDWLSGLFQLGVLPLGSKQ